jgi:hypothetical protein
MKARTKVERIDLEVAEANVKVCELILPHFIHDIKIMGELVRIITSEKAKIELYRQEHEGERS